MVRSRLNSGWRSNSPAALRVASAHRIYADESQGQGPSSQQPGALLPQQAGRARGRSTYHQRRLSYAAEADDAQHGLRRRSLRLISTNHLPPFLFFCVRSAWQGCDSRPARVQLHLPSRHPACIYSTTSGGQSQHIACILRQSFQYRYIQCAFSIVTSIFA